MCKGLIKKDRGANQNRQCCAGQEQAFDPIRGSNREMGYLRIAPDGISKHQRAQDQVGVKIPCIGGLERANDETTKKKPRGSIKVILPPASGEQHGKRPGDRQYGYHESNQMGVQVRVNKCKQRKFCNWPARRGRQDPAGIPIPIAESIRQVHLCHQHHKETFDGPQDALKEVGIIYQTARRGNLLETLVQHTDDTQVTKQNHGRGGRNPGDESGIK